MLKKTSFTPAAPTNPDQIDSLQRRYARLRLELRLNFVDVHDASHGGGFKELCCAAAEQEALENEIAAAEYFLQEDGVTPMEGNPFASCDGNMEETKLRRYYEINPSDDVMLEIADVGA